MTTISAGVVKELREMTGLGMMECKKALVAVGGDIEQAVEELRKSGQSKAANRAKRVAADGVVITRIQQDGRGIILEVNSETDFVARDDNFLKFVDQVLDEISQSGEDDVTKLLVGDLEQARQALVQKIGENVSVRRVRIVRGDVIGSYVHSNKRIAVLVVLKGGNTSVASDIAMHVAATNPRVVNRDAMPAEELAKERSIFRAQAEQSGKPEAIVEKMIQGRVNKYLAENSLLEQEFVKQPDMKVSAFVGAANAEIEQFVRFEVGEGIEKEVVDFASEVRAQAGV